MFDYCVPLFDNSFVYQSLKINYHKPHTYRVEIWRYHRPIFSKTFTKKRVCISWLKKSYFSDMYDDGDCMIYIYLDNRRDSLIYHRFIEGFVEVE